MGSIPRPGSRLCTALVLGLLLEGLLLAGCDSSAPANDEPKANQPWPAREAPPALAAEDVRATMDAVARHQEAALGDPVPGWQQSAYYIGTLAAYRATGSALYLQQATGWAEANEWRPGHRERHADDQAAAQVYLGLYQIDEDPRRLGPTRRRFEHLLEEPRRGREVWDWCDALFMAPPVYAQLSAVLGEARYAARLDTMYWDSASYLYDEDAQLFYRDDRYFGSGTFWARGNGWVVASIARILQQTPSALNRARYRRLLREMAASLSALQQANGLWRSDLRRPSRYATPETSGSAFFVYALAWGLNEGLLPEDEYGPVVRRGWKGLSASVFPSGRLGWVQAPGAEPASVSSADTFPYGSGALLLAGSEVLRWVEARP